MTAIETDTTEKLDFLKSIFEQNWLHARHVENERMWFFNIYGMIMAGTLGFIATRTEKVHLFIPLLLFLIMLSAVGLSIALKQNLEFHNSKSHAIKVAGKVGLKEYAYTPLGDQVRDKNSKESWRHLFSVASLFLLFYTISMSALCGLAMFIVFENNTITLFAFLTIFISVFILIFKYQDNKMTEISNKINQQSKAEH